MSKDNLIFSTSLSYASGRGDWIPEIYKKIFLVNGHTDLVLCHVFSKIVYWHSPSKTGRKKYAGKLPFLSNSILSEQTGLSLKQVRRATECLEKKYKFIKRVRSGRKTHFDLNQKIISKIFLPYMREMGSEDILTLADNSSNSSVPSRADEDISSMPSRAHEEGLVGPGGPAYNIKEPHKLNTELILTKKVDLETKFEDSLFKLNSKSMSESDYLLACKHISVFVQTQLLNGVSSQDIFKDFLSNHLLDHVSYPGFARLHCICNMDEFDNVDENEFKKLLYVVKSECVGNPDLSKMLLKYCADVDYELVGLNLNEYMCKSNHALSKVFDEAINKTKELENYINEG